VISKIDFHIFKNGFRKSLSFITFSFEFFGSLRGDQLSLNKHGSMSFLTFKCIKGHLDHLKVLMAFITPGIFLFRESSLIDQVIIFQKI
jgi:hypothetical protein